MQTEKRRRYVSNSSARSENAAWQIIRIAFWVTLISLAVFVAITLLRLVNRSDEVRHCVYMDRFQVRPGEAPLPPDTNHEPSAFGYFFIDKQQRFVRWRIADDYTSAGVPITDFNLHGPLTPDSADVAPVALDLKATRTPATHYFVGNSTIDTRLILDIQNDPSAYYLALVTGTGTEAREIGRDYLNKLC